MTDMLIAGVDGVVGITWMMRRTKFYRKSKALLQLSGYRNSLYLLKAERNNFFG
jgi:hypothetical protein